MQRSGRCNRQPCRCTCWHQPYLPSRRIFLLDKLCGAVGTDTSESLQWSTSSSHPPSREALQFEFEAEMKWVESAEWPLDHYPLSNQFELAAALSDSHYPHLASAVLQQAAGSTPQPRFF